MVSEMVHAHVKNNYTVISLKPLSLYVVHGLSCVLWNSKLFSLVKSCRDHLCTCWRKPNAGRGGAEIFSGVRA